MNQSEAIIEAPGGKSVKRVVRQNLKTGLKSVLQSLSLAARKSKVDAQAVRQLREACRRALAAVEMSDELLPKRRSKQIKKQLNRILKSTDPLRDVDILIGELTAEQGDPSHDTYFEPLRKSRRKPLRRIRKLNRSINRKGRFKNQVTALVKRVRTAVKVGKQPITTNEWTSNRVGNAVSRFIESGNTDLALNEHLHQFRRDCQQLRHRLELVVPFCSDAQNEKVALLLSELQDRMGRVHDLMVAESQLKPWLVEKEDDSLSDSLASELERIQTKLAHSRADFLKWWTVERRQAVNSALKHLLEEIEKSGQKFAAPSKSRQVKESNNVSG